MFAQETHREFVRPPVPPRRWFFLGKHGTGSPISPWSVTRNLKSIQWGQLQQIVGLIDVGEWFLLHCILISEYITGIDNFVVSCHLITCHWYPHHIHYWKITRFGWFGGDIIWEAPFRASLWRSRCLEGTVSLHSSQLQTRYWRPCLALGGGSKPTGNCRICRMLWAGSKINRCFAWTDLII